jgi:chromosome partitioning protein
MTRVISFISRKGGTGKTTSAINLATALNSLGHKLAVIETDTNYTLSTLRNIEVQERGVANPDFEIYGSDDATIVDDIRKFRHHQQVEYIIVDSAGKTTNENIRQLALESDLIIIPTSLTKNDYIVTLQTVEDLKPARNHNEKLKLYLLPNRIHSATKTETIDRSLSNIDAAIFKNRLTQKNIYANFSTIDPEPEFIPTSKEILAIFDE